MAVVAAVVERREKPWSLGEISGRTQDGKQLLGRLRSSPLPGGQFMLTHSEEYIRFYLKPEPRREGFSVAS